MYVHIILPVQRKFSTTKIIKYSTKTFFDSFKHKQYHHPSPSCLPLARDIASMSRQIFHKLGFLK